MKNNWLYRIFAIMLVVGLLVGASAQVAMAWSVEARTYSFCANDGARIAVGFANTETAHIGDKYWAMTVRYSLNNAPYQSIGGERFEDGRVGIRPGGDTNSYLPTGLQSINAGSVRFEMKWTYPEYRGYSTDYRTVQYNSVSCFKIEAKSTGTCSLAEAEWHWVITQVSSKNQAPQSISVDWDNNGTIDEYVSLGEFTGGVAHYRTTSHSYQELTPSAHTLIYAGWEGEFNLSHHPCPPQPEPDANVQHECLVNPTQLSVSFTNSGDAVATFTWSVNGVAQTPVDVAPNGSEVRTFSVAEDNTYVVVIDGPNGFHKQDTITVDCEKTSEPDANVQHECLVNPTQLSVSFTNSGDAVATFTWSVNGVAQTPVDVAPNGSEVRTFSVAEDNTYVVVIDGPNGFTKQETINVDCEAEPFYSAAAGADCVQGWASFGSNYPFQARVWGVSPLGKAFDTGWRQYEAGHQAANLLWVKPLDSSTHRPEVHVQVKSLSGELRAEGNANPDVVCGACEWITQATAGVIVLPQWAEDPRNIVTWDIAPVGSEIPGAWHLRPAGSTITFSFNEMRNVRSVVSYDNEVKAGEPAPAQLSCQGGNPLPLTWTGDLQFAAPQQYEAAGVTSCTITGATSDSPGGNLCVDRINPQEGDVIIVITQLNQHLYLAVVQR